MKRKRAPSATFKVMQYGKGPWHLILEGYLRTVCGKSTRGARHLQLAFTFIDKGPVRGTAFKVDRVCASCERMKDADTVRLAW